MVAKLSALLVALLLAVSLVLGQSRIGGTGKRGGVSKAGVTAAGTLEARVGSFVESNTTGNQSVTGVGFQPKVVLFWWNRASSDAGDTNAEIGFGVGISSTSRRAIGNRSADAQNPSAHNVSNRDAQCIYLTVGGAGAADFVSQDADGFTINWTTAFGGSMVINYLALGGAALTDVALGNVIAATSTGNQAITGVGFQPTALLLFNGRWTASTNNDTAATANNNYGWGTAAAQGLAAVRSRNAANPQIAGHRQSTSNIAVQYGDSAVVREGALSSLDSDGFTINWSIVSGTADIAYYLALRGPSVKMGAFNQATSTGNQAVTGVGFQGKALLLLSANDVSANNDTVAANSQLSLGAATSSSQRFSMWMGDVNGASPTDADRDLDRTKAIKLFSPGTPTLNAAADFVSFDSDGFTVNWTTADGTARQVLYFVFG